MKYCICLLIFKWLMFIAHAQTLGISTDKTTSLMFPFPIKHVDKGTNDVLAQQVNVNTLLIKAAGKDFSETNLTVFTDDGAVYTFRVLYDPYPRVWIYRLPVFTQATMETYAGGILDNPAIIRGPRDRKWNIEAAITGIYIKAGVIYYQIRVWNRSPIDYETELLRFFIRDKKSSKRTSTQENDLMPLYMIGRINVVKAYSDNVVVVALEKFTIPDAKFLGIQLMEKNGGRHLQMKVRNKFMLQAMTLPDMR